MKLFGLMIMGGSAFQQARAAAVSRAFRDEYEPVIKRHSETIKQNEGQISRLESELRSRRKTEAARPKLTATVEAGKKNRWRFMIKDGDGKIIALPPIRGYDTEERAEEIVKLLSDATIEVDHG